MKTTGWLVALMLCALVPYYGTSQCGTIQTVTYDTTITGSGNNEDPFEFTFPQFNSAEGTLTNVNITATVSLHYDYDVENSTNTTNLYRQRLTRFDNIYSSVLSSEEELELGFLRNFPTNPPPNQYYSHTLAANDADPGTGSDYAQNSLQILNNYTVFNVDVGVANFLGIGNVTLEYFTTTERAVIQQGPVVANNNITDEITVSITYTYCDNILLDPDNTPRVTRNPQINEWKNKLFPNPSINGNFSLQFHDSKRSDWQIDIFNSTGQLVSQKKYNNTLRAEVNNNQLAKGIYIIKVTNLKSQEIFSERLLVK